MNLPESYLKATRITYVALLLANSKSSHPQQNKTLSSQQTRMVTEETIERVAREVLRWPERRKWNSRDIVRRFKAYFGASGTIVADVWNRIVDQGPLESGGEPKHLLWALIHLKVYSTVEIHCSITGWPSAKTFSNVDGTDCPAYEPWPFSRQMYLHKLNGPGMKYKVGVCLKTGWIVWINGPFVGSANDATIFKEGLSTLLHDDEGVEVDRGYKGDDKMKLPDMGMISKQRKMKAKARAQHETVNGRLKIFNVLTTHFQHMKPNRQGMMQKHGMCFNAVAVITQLKFASGETTFDDGLEYDVNYF
eukprot:jgi/Psemu1/36962/gm1.36962_g